MCYKKIKTDVFVLGDNLITKTDQSVVFEEKQMTNAANLRKKILFINHLKPVSCSGKQAKLHQRCIVVM